MPGLPFRQIKEAVSIERAAEFIGLKLKKKGDKQFKTDCPVSGTREALIITPDYVNTDGTLGAFFCFSCKEKGMMHGDMLQLVAKVKKCDVKEAAELILSITQPITVPKVGEPPARDFSKVGDELDPKHPSLEPLGLSPEACKYFGPCGWRGKGFGSGRLLIPVHDATGKRFYGYVARAVRPEQEPLYLWPKGDSGDGLLFNAHRIEGKELHFFTDPVEVMVAWQHGIQAVASFGPPTKASLDALSALIHKHQINHVEII